MARKHGRDAQREMRELVRAEGLSIAYKAAIEICQNPDAPAPAKAKAAVMIFRAAGMFDKPGPGDDSEDKELHEMTRDDIVNNFHQALAELKLINEQTAHNEEAEAAYELDDLNDPDSLFE